MEKILVNWRNKERIEGKVIGEVSWKELFSKGYRMALMIGISILLSSIRIVSAGSRY